jgi:hypothetical protein
VLSTKGKLIPNDIYSVQQAKRLPKVRIWCLDTRDAVMCSFFCLFLQIRAGKIRLLGRIIQSIMILFGCRLVE